MPKTDDPADQPDAGVSPFNEQVSAKLAEYMQANPHGKRTVAGFAAFLTEK